MDLLSTIYQHDINKINIWENHNGKCNLKNAKNCLKQLKEKNKLEEHGCKIP